MQPPLVDRPGFTPGYGVDREATGGMLPWSYAEERLTEARNYWVATTRPDGRAHVAPLWGLWLEGMFVFSTDSASVKGRNLKSSPECAVHLESGDDVVIVEGSASPVTDTTTLATFVERYDAKYGIRVDVNDPGFAVISVLPRLVLAWREQDFPTSATRFRFPHG